MYEIVISGLSGPTNAGDLSRLDGVDCQECFSDYFGREQSNLMNKGVKRGYMKFKLKDGVLYVEVKYTSNEELDLDDLDCLVKYTQGQLSDGIGEGFEQEPVMYDGDREIFISPWFRGQKLEVIQTEI